MIGSFRQSMTWLHTWSGLVLVWIFYFMFVTGTLGYFDAEIDHWMKPEIATLEAAPFDEGLATGLAHAREHAPDADRWFIAAGGTREEPHARVFWNKAAEEEGGEAINENVTLDASTGQPIDEMVRETGGGQLLYRMHYVLHYLNRDVAFRLIGLVTLLMFVGVVTGVIAHKKIFKDFFTFRPRKGQRSWLDAHNLLSVSSLPFLTMITYSGLLFVTFFYMPMIAIGSVGFDTERASKMLDFLNVQVERSGTPAELTDVIAIATAANAEWGEGNVRGVDIRLPGDANARIIVAKTSGVHALGESRVYDGVTGELLESRDGPPNAALSFASVMIGLHEGLFAEPVVRWLYFLAGLLGSAMIATGAIHWTAKRKKKKHSEQSRGYRFVEVMNIGTIVGVLMGIAAFFLANRLLPVEMEGRTEWEAHIMFITWGLCLVYPLFRSSQAAWRDLIAVTALAYAALPVVNALTTDVGLINSIQRGDWIMAGFDLTALGTGVALAAVALFVARRKQPQNEAVMESIPEAVSP